MITAGVGDLLNKREEEDARFVVEVIGDLVETVGDHTRPQNNECPFAFVGRLMGMSTEALEGEAGAAYHDARKAHMFVAIERIAHYRYEQSVKNGDGMAVRQGLAWLVNVVDNPGAYLGVGEREPEVRVLHWADNQLPTC